MGRAVHVAKSVLAGTLGATGILRLAHRARRPHVLVLAYHRVTPDAEMASIAYPAMHVAASTFEAQLVALKRLYRPIPMADLHGIVNGTTPLRESVAVVTFDDGYRDNFEHALPILARQGVPATFFLALDFVDRGRRFWFDAVASALRVWDRDAAVRDAARASLPEPLLCAFEAKGSIADRLRAAAASLKALPDDEREAAVQVLVERTGERVGRTGEALGWGEVRTLQAQGMTIGAHSVRHGILTRMPADGAEEEIRQSVETITARTGVAVREFAYPNGDTNDAVATRAARAGVRLAFTMQPGSVHPGDDPHRLRRRNMSEDTSRSAFGGFSSHYFHCEITGVFDAILRRNRRGG